MFAQPHPIGAVYGDFGFSYIPWEVEWFSTWHGVAYATPIREGGLRWQTYEALYQNRFMRYSQVQFGGALHSPLFSIEESTWEWAGYIPRSDLYEYYRDAAITYMFLPGLDKAGLMQCGVEIRGEFDYFPGLNRVQQMVPAVFRNGTDTAAPPSTSSNVLQYLPGSPHNFDGSVLGGPTDPSDPTICMEGYLFSGTTIQTAASGESAQIRIDVGPMGTLDATYIDVAGSGYGASLSVLFIVNTSTLAEYYPVGTITYTAGSATSVSFSPGELASVPEGTYYVYADGSPGAVYTDHTDSPTGPGATGVLGVCVGLGNVPSSDFTESYWTPSPFYVYDYDSWFFSYNLPTHAKILGTDGFTTPQLVGPICPEVVLAVGYSIVYGYAGPAYCAIRGDFAAPTFPAYFTNGAITPAYDTYGNTIDVPTKTRAVVTRAFVWGDFVRGDIISYWQYRQTSVRYYVYRVELREIAYKTFTYARPGSAVPDWQIYSEKAQAPTWCIVENLGEVEVPDSLTELMDGESGTGMFRADFDALPTIPPGTLVCIVAENSSPIWQTIPEDYDTSLWFFDYWRLLFEASPPPWKIAGLPCETYPNGFIYSPD
jgi:hypothetical protein